MTIKNKIRVAIIGASGYTGVELIRILTNHPKVEIKALIANTNAGQEITEIYSHLNLIELPVLSKLEEIDFATIDLAFSCLPHTAGMEVVTKLLNHPNYRQLKIIDLSADFRLEKAEDYQKWYEHKHHSPELQKQAVYGLSELARNRIKRANLIACPGCYPTSALLPLLPLIEADLIDTNNINIDSKSGVTGAGRSLKMGNLFCEVNDSIKAYGIANHRHTGEIEQELSKAAKKPVVVNFTPHLVPMNRGIISTIYLTLKNNYQVQDLQNCLETKYQDEYFINLINNYPSTRDVMGTNFCKIAIFKARIPGQAIIVSVIDNLTKGASGQAVQNMNILFGFDEKEGLSMMPMVP